MRTAQHAVVVMVDAMADMIVSGATAHPLLTPHLVVVEAIGVVVDPVVVQNHVGREPDHPCGTRLQKCKHLHQSVALLRNR